MNTVLSRPRHSPRSTFQDLRQLMRREHITPGALAWILHSSKPRAIALRYYSGSWTVDEVVRLISALEPESAAVPVWGLLAGTSAA